MLDVRSNVSTQLSIPEILQFDCHSHGFGNLIAEPNDARGPCGGLPSEKIVPAALTTILWFRTAHAIDLG